MQQKLEQLKQDALQALQSVTAPDALEAWEVAFLGRKGALATLMKGLATVSAEERPLLGAKANEVKLGLEQALVEVKTKIEGARWEKKLEEERVDITQPGQLIETGHLHIMTQAIREITEIFERAGFVRSRHPEVDWDYYAFEALNMPKDHPARDEWETFFMDAPIDEKMGKMVLTPHTSNAQVRELQKREFPVRMINIGKCYRRQIDSTHVPMFHQFEGLYVDKGVSVADLRGILDYFVKAFFGPTRVTRLRPFHFRFTEPSFEIDISCGVCQGMGRVDGQKCRMCKRGWLELGGAGMVHPNVLRAAGVSDAEYSGFAFGWGVERTYSMKEGMNIDDLRTIYKNDVRFLQQF
jgi:phenylalanyl-tRNA synthetase alpha chain